MIIFQCSQNSPSFDMFSLSPSLLSCALWHITETLNPTHRQFRSLRQSVDIGQCVVTHLSVRDGGLGVRRVSNSLAIPAFEASAASTLSIQEDILTDCAKSDNDFLQSYLSAWSANFNDVPDILPTKQPWYRPGVKDKVMVEAKNVKKTESRGTFLCNLV